MLRFMTLREELKARIDQMDEPTLVELEKQMQISERRTHLTKAFSMLEEVHKRNDDLSADEAEALAVEAVRAYRQSKN